MSFKAFRENKVFAKIFGFTVCGLYIINWTKDSRFTFMYLTTWSNAFLNVFMWEKMEKMTSISGEAKKKHNQLTPALNVC